MEFLDRGGKENLIYMDAEFQTFRSLKANDKLASAGFVFTKPFVYTEDDNTYNKYQFLLNLGLITIDRYNNRNYYLVSFPSLFGSSSQFEDATILEADYTVATAVTIAALKARRSADIPKFEFFSKLKSGKDKREFKSIHKIYMDGYNADLEKEAKETLFNFVTYAIPSSKFVHKGYTDIDAIANTCRYYKIEVPVINARNIDSFSIPYEEVFHYYGEKKLEAIQTLFVGLDGDLNWLRDFLITEVHWFLQLKYGEQGVIKAHNPLIDAVYTLIVDLYLKKRFGVGLKLKR